MADFGSPVGNTGTYNPSQGLTNLSTLMGIKNAQAQLKNTQAQLPGIQATSAQAQQQNEELSALHDFTTKAMKDPSYQNKDGSPNAEKFQKDAMGIAGTYGQAYIGQATQNFNEGISNKQALLNLSNDQRKTIGNYFAPVAANPNATRSDYLDAIEQARGVSDDKNYQRSIDSLLLATPHTEGKNPEQDSQALRQYARGVSQAVQSTGASASDPQTSTMQGPKGLQVVQTSPQSPLGIGSQGAPMAQGVAPTTKQSITDAYGRVFTFNPQTGNYEPAQVTSPKGEAKPTIGASAPGETTAVTEGAKSDNDLYNSVTNAAKQAPQNKNILANLSKLADSGVFTGTGSQDVAAMEGALGQVIPGFKGAGDAAADRQMMGKFTQQLAMSMTAQNYGTDQARDMVEHAIPNADNMTPAAIKKAASYIQGQQEIAQARGAVADAYSQAHNGSTIGLRHVDTDFMSKIDPRMFDYVSMSADKDKRADFLKQFKTDKEKQDFLSKVAYINHLGGFNYEQP